MLSVKVSSTIRVDEAGAVRVISLKNKSIINRLQNNIVRILKRGAPVKTGKFKKSIIITDSTRRESSGIFQGFAVIGPTVHYKKFVIRKTRPSPGVYVPVLDRKIKFGVHPGTPANNFITRSLPIIKAEAQNIIDDHYGQGKFNIARFIKQ